MPSHSPDREAEDFDSDPISHDTQRRILFDENCMLLPALLVAGLGLSSTAHRHDITFDEYASNNNNTPIHVAHAFRVTFGNDNSGHRGLGSGDPCSWSLLGTNGSAFLGNNWPRNGSTYTTTVNFASLINSVSMSRAQNSLRTARR